MAYPGPERRIHRVYVTKNTEYHIRQNLCIAVRDRRSGRWLRRHLAIQNRLCGALRATAMGGLVPNAGDPSVGESLFISANGSDVVTSPVLAVERPSRSTVALYAT